MELLIQPIDPDEKIIMRFGAKTLTVRRISEHKRLELKHKYMGDAPPKDQRDRELLEQKIGDALLDYALRGWEGVTHPVTGAEVPCTPEFKKNLPAIVKEMVFNRAVATSAASDEELKKEVQDTENLPSSSASDGTTPE